MQMHGQLLPIFPLTDASVIPSAPNRMTIVGLACSVSSVAEHASHIGRCSTATQGVALFTSQHVTRRKSTVFPLLGQSFFSDFRGIFSSSSEKQIEIINHQSLCQRFSIVADGGRQPWDIGRFIRTVTYFNQPPSFRKEDELQTGCNLLRRKDDKRKLEVEENTSMVDGYENQRFFYSQPTEQYIGNSRLPLWKTGKLSAAMISLVLAGLILCPQAWAGTEVASAEESASWLGNLGDIKSGFVSAFLLIFFSEIGDKTFFIAALLASRKSNAAVFTGTFGALVAMTFISVFLGRTFHYIDGILPFSLGENELPLDDLAAVVLLVYFGVSTLLEAASMEGSKVEEEQQEAELAIAGVGGDGAGLQTVANTALATFALVFVAEWGDKSFFSTVALAAASSPLGVVSGAIAGHGVATVLAVLGGSLLSTYISEKVIAFTGGILFLVFAAVTLVEIFR